MRWSEVEDAQPRLAELGHRRLIEPGVVLVATIRRDGTPRLSPVEPLLLDGELWLSGEFHLFAVDIVDITFVRYEDATGDQFVTRWPDGGESCGARHRRPQSVRPRSDTSCSASDVPQRTPL